MNNAEPRGNEVMPFEPGDIPYALTQIARLAEGVKSEFDLIAGRMSWLVVSESFIFSAFVAAISNYQPNHKMAEILLYLIWVLPLVGMYLAVCVFAAIRAADFAVAILKDQRERMMERLPVPLRIDLISTRSREQWWGNAPTHVIPPLLFLVWAGAFALLVL
jgi:hypothetical protein